ncbi:hypothetical protein IGI04_012013 [Brassica rapa subsp. trilocularis]|uniref:F-box domain-containing protein n=1 Tax=Brassica rapa subsp. trilocularis TaxID=1813537 RepID=A0ABQ7N4Q1_BRACM|nr:hypothetical protein IGI04_012013 [Brassica rapa subsp. trilocularis]
MISDLPQDLIEETLSRVPVKSLRRLRSTCKRWYHQALFKDPRFIKKHFDKTARQYHALMVMSSWVCPVSSVLDRSVLTTETDLVLGGRISLTVPNSDGALVDVSNAFHCDGILLCTNHEANMLVAWNPFSGQTRWLQPHTRNYFGIYALGYDKNELFRNYKILRVPCRKGKLSVWEKLGATPESDDLKPEIYEFRTNSWRSLDAIITPQAFINTCGVSLKGSTYWVSSGNGYSLLRFDFSTERFQPLCGPIGHDDHFGTMTLSVVREERISLFYQSRETRKVEIWMTDEIETTFVSWSKFLTIDVDPFFSNSMSFFIIDEEKKVFLCCDKRGQSFLLVAVGSDSSAVRVEMDENSNDFSFNMYNPRLKIDKLLFLADRGVNRTESLSAACRLIKLGDSPNLLRRVRSKYKMESDADDSLWLRRADERFSRAKSTYESSCFSQETINLEGKRKLYSKLGKLHYYSGDLGKAFENHLQELAHCTMVNQRIDSNMKLILVSLKRGKLDDVLKWVNEIRTQYDPLESIVAAKVACAHALSHMGLGEYKTAALEFLDVDCVALGDTFYQVILPRDVATYGGLCALATYDRSEIQQRVFENDHTWRKTLLLDMYVYQHVEWLLGQIREKALLEYAQPFASLRMCAMASQFRSSVPDLEEELMALIKKNKLEACIDSQTKVLYKNAHFQPNK